jgi:hypothetical protein
VRARSLYTCGRDSRFPDLDSVHDTALDTDDAMTAGSTSDDAAAPPSSSDDYVWDVFYRRPAALKELDEGSLSNIATL